MDCLLWERGREHTWLKGIWNMNIMWLLCLPELPIFKCIFLEFLYLFCPNISTHLQDFEKLVYSVGVGLINVLIFPWWYYRVCSIYASDNIKESCNFILTDHLFCGRCRVNHVIATFSTAGSARLTDYCNIPAVYAYIDWNHSKLNLCLLVQQSIHRRWNVAAPFAFIPQRQ